MKRDTITGITGLAGSLIWLILIQYQTRQPANLLEPGPRLLPYVSFFIVAISSLMLLIEGIQSGRSARRRGASCGDERLNQDAAQEKPYFPKGGVLKVTKSYGMLVLYGVAMAFVGFLLSTPFACFAFIYDLKGAAKVKPLIVALISMAVTFGLYAMFVFGFQISLPVGILFE